jgi:hypothetical protein
LLSFLGKIKWIGQSAGNFACRKNKEEAALCIFFCCHTIKKKFCMKHKGSSETLREATKSFDFSLFQQKTPYPLQSHHFYAWFIGFTEGDGALLSSWAKDPRHKNPQLSQRLFFFIVQKEERILHRIRKWLGFGSVQKHGKYFRYAVTKKEHLYLLFCLFNGNLVCQHRQQQCSVWAEYFQEPSKPRCFPLSFFTTAWLSGFTDAEGCFSGRRFILDQSNEKDLFVSLSVQCQAKKPAFYQRKAAKSEHMYRFELRDRKLLAQWFVPYFQTYRLQTKKATDYFRWRKEWFPEQHSTG